MIDLDEHVMQGDAVARFLSDPTIKKVFADIDHIYYKQMMAAETPAERDQIWAKGRALDDLNKVLQGTVDRGVLAKLQLEQRDKPALD